MKAAEDPDTSPSSDPFESERRAVYQAEVEFAATQSRASLGVAFVVALLALVGSMSIFTLQSYSDDLSEYDADLQEVLVADRDAASADERCVREQDANRVKTDLLLQALKGLEKEFDREQALELVTSDRFTIESEACDGFQASADRVETLDALRGDPPSEALSRNAGIGFLVVVLLTFLASHMHTRAVTNAGSRLVKARSNLSDAEAKAAKDAQAAQAEAQAAKPAQSDGPISWLRRLLA